MESRFQFDFTSCGFEDQRTCGVCLKIVGFAVFPLIISARNVILCNHLAVRGAVVSWWGI